MEPVATDYQRGHKQAEHQFGILQRGEHLSGTEHLFHGDRHKIFAD